MEEYKDSAGRALRDTASRRAHVADQAREGNPGPQRKGKKAGSLTGVRSAPSSAGESDVGGAPPKRGRRGQLQGQA